MSLRLSLRGEGLRRKDRGWRRSRLVDVVAVAVVLVVVFVAEEPWGRRIGS